MTGDCGSRSIRMRRLRRGARFGFPMILSVAVACGGTRKPQAEIPSRKEFFLQRNTPVDSVRVATTEAAASASTPAGEVDGLVVDGFWGEPLAGAQVISRDSAHPGEAIGVITDADGHFTLKGIPRRSVLIQASLVGYRADTVRLDGNSGQFVRFGLRRQAMRACGLIVLTDPAQKPPFAISVYARDARTGRAPIVPVTITLRDGKFMESATVTMRDGDADSVLVGAAPGRDGVYDVEVTARSYRPWYLRRARPVVSDCDQVMGRGFPAWLIPTS